MAITLVKNPKSAGLTEVGKRENNYLPMQVFHKPVWDQMMFEQSNSYWFTSLVEDYAGEMEPIASNEFFWVEDGKWYGKQHVASATEDSPGVYTLTLQETTQYFVNNDVIDLGVAFPGFDGVNVLGRVTATGETGGAQTITVTLIESFGSLTGLFSATDLPAGQEIALLYNSFGECFKKSDCRIHTPERFTNCLTKLNDCYAICDEAMDQGTWFRNTVNGKFYWMDQETKNLMRMHRMKRDMALLFGQKHSFVDSENANYTGVGGWGLIPLLAQGSTVSKFAGSVTEDDIIEMITALSCHSPCKMYHVLCGKNMYRDIQKALKDYALSGAINYGSFKSNSIKVGLNFAEYQFGETVLRFMEYKPFSDPDFLPQNANGVDYSNFALFLCLEGDRIKVVYKKKHGGDKIKDWLSRSVGSTRNERGGLVTNDRACLELDYTTHVGLQMKGLNDHGILCSG